MNHLMCFLGRLFALVFLGGSIALSLKADSVFEKITEEQGLGNNTVRCIFQDSTGFLWLGTDEGLYRYDGYNFILNKNAPHRRDSGSDNSITVIREDRKGILWIGTKSGLNSFDPRTERWTKHFSFPGDAASQGSSHITSILIDQTGTIWVGTLGNGLNRLDAEASRLFRFGHNPFFDYISALYQDEAGMLWIGTLNDGMICLNPANSQWKNFRNTSSPENNVTSILKDDKGQLWVGTKAGLRLFNPLIQMWVSLADSSPIPPRAFALEINSLYRDRAKNIWIGTGIESEGDGLFQFNPTQKTWRQWRHSANNPDSLSQNTVISLFEDRSGLFWFGTDGYGVCKYDPVKENWRHFRVDPAKPMINLTTTFITDHKGILWIGTNGAGLFAWDRQKDTWKNHLNGQYIRAVTEDLQGNLWVGTFSAGLYRLDRKRRNWQQYRSNPQGSNGLSSNNIKALCQDRSGKLWIGTWDKGLNRFDPQKQEWMQFKSNPKQQQGPSFNMISCILEDHAGDLWIGSRGGGLNRLDQQSGEWTYYQNKPSDANSISNNNVRFILEDLSGNLWIGTNEGLNRLDRQWQKWFRYSQAEGLAGNIIFGIVEDTHHRIWVSTNKGLSRLNQRTGKIRNFDTHDGLKSIEFEPYAMYKSREGEIFLGWKNSFTAFYPDLIQDNPLPPPVVITDFRIFNESTRHLLDRPEGISLSYKRNFVFFEFSALDFRNPGKNQFAYKMEGINRDWIMSGNQRSVNFLLNDGRYIFRIKAANRDGIWNEQGQAVVVTIVPPFWKKPMFYGLVLLLVVATAAGSYRIRIRSLKSRQIELARQVEERTKQLSLAFVDLDQINKDLQKQIGQRQLMERALKESNQKLQESYEKLKELDHLKTDFLNLVSHELRTPLTSVIGFTKIIKRRLVETIFPNIPQDSKMSKVLEQVNQNMDIILLEGKRLTKLINDLLDIAKIEAGKLEWKRESISPATLIREALVFTSPLFEEKRLRLFTRLETEVGDVTGDRDRINQVIINLLSNAIKFTPPEGMITISCKTIKSGEEQTENGRNELEISISDTGPGIEPESQPHLFEKFRQVSNPADGTMHGTGLGLHICKQIVEHHGGRIWVESEPGKGSTFCFRLPLKDR